jgi:hypothetical protein
MKRFTHSITRDGKALEPDRKEQMLGSIPENASVVLGEYLAEQKK